MSLKVEITENKIKCEGTGIELLAGLRCYIEALIENGIPRDFIKKVIDFKLDEEKKKEYKNKMKNTKGEVKRVNLNNMSKEEAKDFITKAILKMFD